MPNTFVIINKVLKNETLGPLKKDEICGKVFMKKKNYIICCYLSNNLKYLNISSLVLLVLFLVNTAKKNVSW